MQSKKTIIAISIVAISISAISFTKAVASEDWDFRVAPYFWTAGLTGDLGPKSHPASVNMDFSDVISMAEIGFMIFTEAQYQDTWGVLADFMYIELSEGGTGPMGGSVDMDTEFGLITFGASHQCAENVAIYAGGRWVSMDTTVDATPGPRVNDKEDWVDPIVGVRLRGVISDDWAMNVAGDVGGFSANSDITWHALANAEYSFNDTWSGILGYRLLDIDYDKDGFIANFVMSGLLLGVGAQF